MGNRILLTAAVRLCVAATVSVSTAPARAEFGDELFKLNASDAVTGNQFGRNVDISGNAAIIGDPIGHHPLEYSGAVYVFDVTTGQQRHKLTASDATPLHNFGGGVSISGNVAIIGGFSTDKAYLFDVTTGRELRQLTTSDPMARSFANESVAISGNIAIVGAFSHTGLGLGTGAAYVFDVTTGQELFKLTASDAAAHDQFGRSVAISGNVAIIGAPQPSREPAGLGAAYLFDATPTIAISPLIATLRPKKSLGRPGVRNL
jgi:outer membrane protein assembly factor BamB